jgi:hypothetical protein
MDESKQCGGEKDIFEAVSLGGPQKEDNSLIDSPSDLQRVSCPAQRAYYWLKRSIARSSHKTLVRGRDAMSSGKTLSGHSASSVVQFLSDFQSFICDNHKID